MSVLTQRFLKGVLLLMFVLPLVAQGRQSSDTIFTTKGATTLITCGAQISTFQIGDGKSTDYDYRIVDGNMVFIRAVGANPRATNLIVREGDQVHYLILFYKEKADLAMLNYTLSKDKGFAKNGGSGGRNSGSSGTAAGSVNKADDDVGEAPVVNIAPEDTLAVSRITDDLVKDRKFSQQYEVRVDGVILNFSHAMTLSEYSYFRYRLRNRSKDAFEIGNVSLMRKENGDSAKLQSLPIVYKRNLDVVGGKDEVSVVVVVPKQVFSRNDELIMVIQKRNSQGQLVLYTAVSTFPKYMRSAK